MNKQIELGDVVKDRVTGFTGVATMKVEHLNGCVQYAVKPKQKRKEITMPEGVMIDDGQLTVIKKNAIDMLKKPEQKEGPGGDYVTANKIRC